jgi:hypothetical protein
MTKVFLSIAIIERASALDTAKIDEITVLKASSTRGKAFIDSPFRATM